jgi:hypothetical protein
LAGFTDSGLTQLAVDYFGYHISRTFGPPNRLNIGQIEATGNDIQFVDGELHSGFASFNVVPQDASFADVCDTSCSFPSLFDRQPN